MTQPPDPGPAEPRTSDSAAPHSPSRPSAEPTAPPRAEPAAPPRTERGDSEQASAVRRARLAEVFGDVLPEVTSDERDSSSAAGRGEDWYRENRPPHHDRD